MEKYKDLPVFFPDFSSEDDGIDKISLVEFPAFERDFVYYSGLKKYSINEEKREITGPVIIANTPILRNDPPIGYHYVVFDEQSIIEARNRFFKNKHIDETNIHHRTDVEGLYIVGSFIKDERFSIVDFEDLPSGSWLVTYKVENDDVWKLVKEGKVKGFSMEVLYDLKEGEYQTNKYNILFEMEQKTNLTKRIKYAKDVRALFQKTASKYASVMTDKGELAFDGELEEGATNCVLYNPDPEPAPDGNYNVLNDAGETTEVITIADQTITGISTPGESSTTTDMETEEEIEIEEVKEEAKSEIEAVVDILVSEIEQISSDYSATKTENEELKDKCKQLESKYSALEVEMQDIKKLLKTPIKGPKKPESSFETTSPGIRLGTKA